MDLTTFGLCLFIGGAVGWVFTPIRPLPELRLDDIFPLLALIGLVILVWQLFQALFKGEL